MRYVVYTTKPGERWDAIAYAAYGDANAYPGIIAANPTIPITPSLPGGLKLYIPIKDSPAPASSSLPPWKR